MKVPVALNRLLSNMKVFWEQEGVFWVGEGVSDVVQAWERGMAAEAVAKYYTHSYTLKSYTGYPNLHQLLTWCRSE